MSFSPFVISSLKTLRGRSADRRNCPVTAPRKAHVAIRLALGARARHTGRARLPALRRGTCGSERTPPLSFSPRFLGPGVIRCYLHLTCPQVQRVSPQYRSSCRTGVSAEAARERVTNPARENRTRSVSGIVSRNVLTRARCFGFKLIRRWLSNAAAELGNVDPCKSLKQRHCCRETLDRNCFDARCARSRKLI
jgi:hypothetical protein